MVAEEARTRKAARSLTRAIRGLPEREQNDVLCYLLESALAAGGGMGGRTGGGPGPFGAVVAQHPGQPMFELATHASATRPGGEQRMIPVRLPEPLYARLKAWSGEHGFAMAVVIRGLVERFLDDQGAAAPKPRPTRTRSRPSARAR